MGLSGETPLGEAKTKAQNSDYHKNEPPGGARHESAGRTGSKSDGAVRGARARRECAVRKRQERQRGPVQRAPEQRCCGTDARGQRDRQRGPREAGAWSAPEKRTFSKLQLPDLGF